MNNNEYHRRGGQKSGMRIGEKSLKSPLRRARGECRNEAEQHDGNEADVVGGVPVDNGLPETPLATK